MDKSVYIIDGNNLAYPLYNLRKWSKLDWQIDRLLVNHLAGWVNQHLELVEVELCLDRCFVDFDYIPQMKVYSTDFPMEADDIVTFRFNVHYSKHHPVIIVSGDNPLHDEFWGKDYYFLHTSKFILEASCENPRFINPTAPFSLGSSDHERVAMQGSTHVDFPIHQHIKPNRVEKAIHRPKLEDEIEEETFEKWEAEALKRQKDKIIYEQMIGRLLSGYEAIYASAKQVSPSERDQVASIYTPLEAEILDDAEQGEIEPNIIDMAIVDTPPVESEKKLIGPFYQLSFNNWSALSAIKFIMDAFCPLHKAEIQSLIAELTLDECSSPDLRALAVLLLESCSNEPGFMLRGSLIDRARLVMLVARGFPLNIETIATNAHANLGNLRRKIRKYIGKSIEIVE